MAIRSLQRGASRALMMIVFESALIISAVLLPMFVYMERTLWWLIADQTRMLKVLLITAIFQLCLHYRDLYDGLRVSADRRELLVRVLQALGAASIILACLYFIFPPLILGRGVFATAIILVMFLAVTWRALLEWAFRRVLPRERLLLVGTTPAAVALARELHERHELGVEIVGFVDSDTRRVGVRVFNPSVIGTIEDIPAIVRSRFVDRVAVSLADARGQLPMDKLLEMKLQGLTFDHLASLYEEYTGKIAIENLRPSWLIFSSGFQKSQLLNVGKRITDIVVSSIGMVVLFPVMLAVALAVRFSSPGPVLYRQQRVGREGRIFEICKFRSMHADAEAQTGAIWAQAEDARVTTVGRALRRARLDELPQLWSVLKGDMSLVGPRPERPQFVRELSHQIPFYGLRHVVKPGLSGWAQVRYTYTATVEDALEKLQYDLYYIKNMSMGLDLFIIFETLKIVILRRGAR